MPGATSVTSLVGVRSEAVIAENSVRTSPRSRRFTRRSFVPVVESSHFWKLDHVAQVRLWLPITPSAVAAAPAITVDPFVDFRDGVVLLAPAVRVRGRASGRPAPLQRDTSSCGGALVSMMQPANLRQLDDPAQLGTLHPPGLRRVAHQ